MQVMQKRCGSDADPASAAPESGDDVARRRALELARAQATDEEVAAALRDELASSSPPVVSKGAITRIVRELAKKVGPAKLSKLDDARVAGRLAPLVSLLQTASDPDARDRTAAAQALARRSEKDLDAEHKRAMAKLAAMSPRERQAYAEELGVQAGAL